MGFDFLERHLDCPYLFAVELNNSRSNFKQLPRQARSKCPSHPSSKRAQIYATVFTAVPSVQARGVVEGEDLERGVAVG